MKSFPFVSPIWWVSKIQGVKFLMGPPKDKFAHQTFAMFVKVVENSFIMVKNIQQTNVLLEKVDIQMDCLINKLS
jgi:hypothetical protein